MINYNLLNIHRAILHKVMAKRQDAEPEVEESDRTIIVNPAIEQIFRKRLSEAFGQAGKAFELAVNAIEADSAFAQLNGLRNLSETDFIETSKALANKLAETQTKMSIPHGFFILLDCSYNNLPVHIVMKAEPHDALSIANNVASALENIILSPSQKMYKAACFQRVSLNVTGVTGYKVYLFDETFASRAHLAEYFYKDFLGLTISQNDKILTKMFYVKVKESIKSKYEHDVVQKNQIDMLFDAEMQNQDRFVQPRTVIDRIVPVEDRDYFYSRSIPEEMPTRFSKNLSLIDNRLARRAYDITQSVKLFAPQDLFSESIVVDRDSDNEYVIVKIAKAR